MSTILGVDMSIYGGLLTAQEAANLYHEGYRLACIGGWHGRTKNPYAEISLRNVRHAGLMTATYTALNDISGAMAVDNCRAACGPEWDHVRFVALDCETDSITKAIITQAERRCRALQKVPVVYTARWWWEGRFGNPTDFAHLLLWNAHYDADQDIDFGNRPYGGWTLDSLIGEQFTGTVIVAGQSVDRDVFVKEVLDDMVDMDRVKKLIAALEIMYYVTDHLLTEVTDAAEGATVITKLPRARYDEANYILQALKP